MADKEKVSGHRKDNSEWGKRMEKELGRIDKRQQASAKTIVTGIDEEAIEVEVNEDILTGSDEESIPILFQKGHSNLGRACAKFFEAVLHHGNVTEVIPRRKGYFYKITYEDGDQEDMDEAELIFAIQLKHKKDKGEEVQDETEVLSGLSEEGSAYDSEEDRKALKEATKKRKAVVASAKTSSKNKRSNAKKWRVCPESVAKLVPLL